MHRFPAFNTKRFKGYGTRHTLERTIHLRHKPVWVTTFDIETRNIHGHIVGAEAHNLQYSITVRRNATSSAMLGGLE